jgi:hypothetical protein
MSHLTLRVATAKTVAGRNRQVAEGRADTTAQNNGLVREDLVQNKSGRWVSKARSSKALNAYMQLAQEARRENLDFSYKGSTYVRDKTSTGMVIYRKHQEV